MDGVNQILPFARHPNFWPISFSPGAFPTKHRCLRCSELQSWVASVQWELTLCWALLPWATAVRYPQRVIRKFTSCFPSMKDNHLIVSAHQFQTSTVLCVLFNYTVFGFRGKKLEKGPSLLLVTLITLNIIFKIISNVFYYVLIKKKQSGRHLSLFVQLFVHDTLIIKSWLCLFRFVIIKQRN